MPRDHVQGHCPACGHPSLVRGFQGRIVCERIEDCPDTEAAHTLLTQDHITRHRVEIRPNGIWTIQHPLIERTKGDLFTCQLALDLTVRLRDVGPAFMEQMVGKWMIGDLASEWVPVSAASTAF